MEQRYKKQLAWLKKRVAHKAYRSKSYFDLTPKYRELLQEDFSRVLSVAYTFQTEEARHQKWWTKHDEGMFLQGFVPFWLARHFINTYTKALGNNAVTDTFLNDYADGNRGSLADLRQLNSNPKTIRKAFRATVLIRKNKIRKGSELMRRYPVSLKAESVSFRKLLKFRLLWFWMPAQVYVSNILPHKFWFWKKAVLVTNEQLDDMELYLQKGDILLQRTNYQLTNATLPGFWTHTMLYDGEGHIIESTPPKVRKIPWKRTLKADYIAVLRPRCSRKEKDRAVKYANTQIGKPYDFNFDFLADEGLVCSELILKAYPYLKQEIPSIFGRLAFQSSLFIKLFNENKLEFVYFLDGRQWKNRALLGTPEELAKSYLRSKWDLIQK